MLDIWLSSAVQKGQHHRLEQVWEALQCFLWIPIDSSLEMHLFKNPVKSTNNRNYMEDLWAVNILL